MSDIGPLHIFTAFKDQAGSKNDPFWHNSEHFNSLNYSIIILTKAYLSKKIILSDAHTRKWKTPQF